MAAKRASGAGGARKRGAAKRGTGRREMIEPRRGDKRYVRRTGSGQFTDSQDDVGRSLGRDVKQRARKTVAAGRGDEGDQKRRPSRAKSATKKSAAKRSSAKKSSARKSSAKKSSARKSTAKKTGAKRSSTRKSASKRTSSR